MERRACLVSAILSVAVVIGLGFLFAGPVFWVWGDISVRKKEVGTVAFFGRVIDSEGVPLSGADVSGELFKVGVLGAREFKTVQLITDESGRFAIGPTPGVSLKIKEISKSGYQPSGRNYWVFNFSANGRIPEEFREAQPYVFRMVATSPASDAPITSDSASVGH